MGWIGVVPFRMTNVAPRGVPSLPWISAFPEQNVRTYVRVDHRPGVFFFSLDEAVGPPVNAVAGTLDHFLTERYCLYHRDQRSAPYRGHRRVDAGAPGWLTVGLRQAGPSCGREPSYTVLDFVMVALWNRESRSASA